MSVVVRFPPSPTGFLHIGGARTALFNWLYAKHHNGNFLMRVEDTDRERSTPESIETIIEGMKWLGFDWDNKDPSKNNGKEYYSQYDMRDRHVEIAEKLLKEGKAYYCYCSKEELDEMRQAQKDAKETIRYNGKWRDKSPDEAPKGVKPVIRLKMPLDGETIIDDKVMGSITVKNDQLDDMILVRADGSPTYMLAVVVDDHDMGVTHIIRGDDHLTNSFRQIQIYKAMGWEEPVYAHLPLILGEDGAKLSKRHGSPAVSDYKDKGYLPEAICNYLLRLCWSHGDDEIISTEQAIKWFDFDGIGKSPARFDFTKLKHLNAHYIKEMTDKDCAVKAKPFVEKKLGRKLSKDEMDVLIKALPDIKPRVHLLTEIADASHFYFEEISPDEKALKLLDDEAKKHLNNLCKLLENIDDFTQDNVKEIMKEYAKTNDLKLGKIAQPLRSALTGSTVSPPIFAAAALLGREEVLKRLKNIVC